jgi:hypothetical protein
VKTSAQDSSSSAARPKSKISQPRAADVTLEAGSINAGVYRNPAYGFTCKIPPSWVLRSDEMNARDAENETSSVDKTSGDAPQSGRVLLAAFSRPPEARGEDVNASVLIAAESAAAYPGLKDAAQYFGPVTEIAKAQGFEIDEEPYELVIGAKKLVRADFHKDVGTRVMRQSTLALLARGWIVSFTFIGGTGDEVEELIAGLSFAGAIKSPPH